MATEIPAMPELFSDIVDLIGLEGEFQLKEARVLNLEATVEHGKKYVLYNPDYIDWLNRATRDKWAVLTLLAHEIGHHVNGHTRRRSGSKPRIELQADQYAGYVLHQLGASLQQTQEVMHLVASARGSRTHPSRAARLSALAKGWSKAAGSSRAGIAF
jgi:hypothetical protein